jgi:hypothetical protein
MLSRTALPTSLGLISVVSLLAVVVGAVRATTAAACVCGTGAGGVAIGCVEVALRAEGCNAELSTVIRISVGWRGEA